MSTRAVEPRDDPVGHRLAHVRKDDGDRPRLPLDRSGRRGRAGQDDVGFQLRPADRRRAVVANRYFPTSSAS